MDHAQPWSDAHFHDEFALGLVLLGMHILIHFVSASKALHMGAVQHWRVNEEHNAPDFMQQIRLIHLQENKSCFMLNWGMTAYSCNEIIPFVQTLVHSVAGHTVQCAIYHSFARKYIVFHAEGTFQRRKNALPDIQSGQRDPRSMP